MPLEIVDTKGLLEKETDYKNKARLKLKKMTMVRKQLLDNRIGIIRSVVEERIDSTVSDFDRPKTLAAISDIGGESDELSRAHPDKEVDGVRGNFGSLVKMF